MSTTNSGAGDVGPLHDLRRHVLSLLHLQQVLQRRLLRLLIRHQRHHILQRGSMASAHAAAPQRSAVLPGQRRPHAWTVHVRMHVLLLLLLLLPT